MTQDKWIEEFDVISGDGHIRAFIARKKEEWEKEARQEERKRMLEVPE